MRRNPLALAIFALVGLSIAGLATRTVAADVAPLRIEAEALDTAPGSSIEGRAAMHGAIAAAVIGAVTEQFSEQTVAVKLGNVDVEAASLRDRQLQGRGELQIGDDMTWIPFEFEALYDTRETSVSYPRLSIGEGVTSDPVPVHSELARELRQRAGEAMLAEFAQQPVSLSLDDVRAKQEGSRYLRFEALGTADFGAEGNTAAQVRGLYDSKAERWVRVNYELGVVPSWADVEPDEVVELVDRVASR